MPDAIRHDDLMSLQVRRDANQLHRGVNSIVSGGERDVYAILMVMAMFFIDACDMVDIDPLAAFEQLADAHTSGYLNLNDDPAEGRFVFPEHRA